LHVDQRPEVGEAQKIRSVVAVFGVRLVGCLLRVERAFARILHRQRCDNRQHFVETALAICGDQHAGQAWVDGQSGHLFAGPGQIAFAVDRAEFVQQQIPVIDEAPLRGLDKGKVFNRTQTQCGHLQDHRGEVGAQYFRVGEFGAGVEVVFAVEANGDTGGFSPAAA